MLGTSGAEGQSTSLRKTGTIRRRGSCGRRRAGSSASSARSSALSAAPRLRAGRPTATATGTGAGARSGAPPTGMEGPCDLRLSKRHQEPPQPVGAALGSASAGTESGETAAADAPSDAGGRGPGGCAALDDGGWGGPVPCGDDGWGSPLPSPRRTAESAAVLAAQGRAEDSLRSPTTPAGPPAAPAGCEGTSGEAKGDPGPAAPPHRAARGASPSGDPPAESGAASASSGIAVRKEGFEPSAPPAEELGISPGATGRDDLLESQRQEIEELRAALERAKLGSSGPPAPSAPPMPDLPPIPTCEMFTFQELHEATGGFAPSNRLGAGGFGEVFRGVLRSHTRVAVKRLTANSMQGPEALWREVGVLSRVRHPHLVLLLGACPEHGCIVYELMEGGSLQDALSPAGSGREPLEWQDRVRIAAEMATALLVLHQAQPQPILHRDFKPANVLLDAHLTAKLADVGLARIAPELGPGRSHVVDTTPVGTFDYIDPEYLHTGRFAPASDTYSLGVALLQLLTGRPPRGSDGRTLHDAVRTLCASRMVHDAVDPSSVRKTRWPLEDARAFAELALQCCAYNRRDRPPLIEVVGLLRDLAARAHREASECARRQHGELGGQMGQRVTPAMFLCPITREVMEDPVVAADGFTYERVAIQAWLERGRDRSPMSNARLPHRELTPNHTLRSAIREWLEGGSGRLSEA
uniref:U-box domain-containing protein 33-like isoform x1 n=1 Tax=Tetraselmis sp. GSL018 TaxID=582737 RepID=A0A061SCY0_9CHLO